MSRKANGIAPQQFVRVPLRTVNGTLNKDIYAAVKGDFK